MQESYSILIAGDLFPSEKNIHMFLDGDYNGLYGHMLLSIFKTADYRICNLEGCLTNQEVSIRKVDPTIRAPQKCINGIQGLNFQCVSLANNHIIDYGLQGYLDTCQVLKKAGISFFGAGENEESISSHQMVELGGTKICIFAVSETMFNQPGPEKPGVNCYDEYAVCKEIRELRDQCDYMVVLYHGGTEFFWYNTPELRKRFHRMADNGADFITAQHTHCIGITEQYNGAYLLYGQGDFLFARRESEYRKYGLLMELKVNKQQVVVNRHLLEHIGSHVEYAKEQDFTQFDERSARFASGDLFDKEYAAYCKEMSGKFFSAFRGRNLKDKLVKKLVSKPRYIEYLKRQYNTNQLLRIFSGIHFEEYSELLTKSIVDLLNMH